LQFVNGSSQLEKRNGSNLFYISHRCQQDNKACLYVPTIRVVCRLSGNIRNGSEDCSDSKYD
jgi:hypothetical protein